ncbi:DHH family phosphoesterase [Ferroacidibacillus organovorans]|uniref:Exopolyphosphatase n=1 Tax=Ferroacidibacillus organovorans TaxID=1765683 RepID=A0A101XSZ4_9BACL|nr:bifunctional oligoribonuclease/PAP phosphatase NrnA [Ferroacidibacillus organovorans]KUO96983.1 hypothetical protein ATW55_07070 [Ferroacidibacillus organovorans]
MDRDDDDLKMYEQITGPRDPLLIVCHISPDGDAIGAALAMALMCDQVGRAVTLANDDPIPNRYAFLPGAERFVRTGDLTGTFNQILAVDCADQRRMGETLHKKSQTGTLLNIDHHETNCGFGDVNLVDPQASATCLVLYRMLRRADVPISRDMALCIYTGIVFDTGGFRYNNTTPEIHQVAADLLSRGFQPFMVADRVLEALTREQVELVRLGLATLEVDENGRIAYVSVTQDMIAKSGADEGEAEVLLPYTRSLSGVEVGLLFRERANGDVKVSLRSRDRVDVAAIALAFSGGGHVRAAGCQVPGPLTDAITRVLKMVRAAVAEADAHV